MPPPDRIEIPAERHVRGAQVLRREEAVERALA
jgi:hypothetical protein